MNVNAALLVYHSVALQNGFTPVFVDDFNGF